LFASKLQLGQTITVRLILIPHPPAVFGIPHLFLHHWYFSLLPVIVTHLILPSFAKLCGENLLSQYAIRGVRRVIEDGYRHVDMKKMVLENAVFILISCSLRRIPVNRSSSSVFSVLKRQFNLRTCPSSSELVKRWRRLTRILYKGRVRETPESHGITRA
jgi:hypothetical protein